MKTNGSINSMNIIKRDGRIVPFDIEKITFAIFKALRAVELPNRMLANQIAQQVTEKIKQTKKAEIPTVEEIQDGVERELFEQDLFAAGKAYILYRSQHANIRSSRELFGNIDLIDSYINNQDWRVKESANSTYSLQGLNQHISTLISSQYWLEKIYPPEIADAHKNGKLHIHDLGYLSVYCVGWDLEDLLISGFKGVSGKTESKPARHLRTALGQIVNFFYTMQGEAAGAQAFSNFDVNA
ncbi:MAG: hypothetical protein JEZ03_12595 [Bacteroidales bacterium]|nr:hypothetical protein [Bacteroidales bacterium]